MDNSWVFDIQDKIFSRLEAICLSKLSGSYKDITVTMDDHVPTKPKFPNVYLHFLPAAEVGKDLNGEDVNAVYLTAQIEVTVTSAQGMPVAKKVSMVVLECMKEMRFVSTMPEFVNTDTEYRTVSRFARTIGNAESLYEN